MYSGGKLLPISSRSFVDHHRSPVSGRIASPTQLRKLHAKTLQARTVRVELEHVGAMELPGIAVRVVHV